MMDELFFKVFKNTYLNKLIFNFIKNQDNDYVSIYNDIIDSYNVVDLEICELLKKKKYNLLNSLIDNYFKYLIIIKKEEEGEEEEQIKEEQQQQQQSTKWWFYILNPNKNDIKQLLRWNQLDFNRFKLIYNEFKEIFKLSSKSLIKNAIVGGNFEIVQFLIDQGYPLNLNVKNISNAEMEKFNCGGNLKLFNLILDNCNLYKGLGINSSEKLTLIIGISNKLNLSYNKYFNKNSKSNNNNNNNNTDQDKIWISVSPSTSLLYYEIYKSSLIDSSMNESQIKIIFDTCIKNSDLSLAKALIETINQHNYINSNSNNIDLSNIYTSGSLIYNSINNLYDPYRLMFSKESFNVLKFIYENYKNYNGKCENKIEDIILFVSNANFDKNRNIYRLNVENRLASDILQKLLIINKRSRDGYIPNSLEEFKFILNNQILKKLFKSVDFTRVLEHISLKICNLDYLKFAISYYFPKLKDMVYGNDDENYNLKQEMENEINKLSNEFIYIIESTYEIVSWLLHTFNKVINWSELPNSNHHEFINCFFGDLKTVQLVVESKIKIPIPVLEIIIENDYNEIYSYLIENYNYSLKDVITWSFIHSYRFNNFEIYILLVDKLDDYNKSKIKQNIQQINPLFLSYWLKFDKINNEKLTIRELLLESIYKHNNFKFLNDLIYNSSDKYGNHFDNISNLNTIKSNSTKVLNYIFNKSTTLLNNLFNNKYQISNLIRFNTKKLIYLLNLNNRQGLNLILNNIEFLKLIIKESILSNNYFILNYIFDINCSNKEFINQFNLNFTNYSNLLIYKNKKNSNGINLNLVALNNLNKKIFL